MPEPKEGEDDGDNERNLDDELDALNFEDDLSDDDLDLR
jgi:hypothetical protein